MHALQLSSRKQQANLKAIFGLNVTDDGRQVNAKSIMGVMMLAASKGSTISLEATGEDETAAIEALLELINNRFGEPE